MRFEVFQQRDDELEDGDPAVGEDEGPHVEEQRVGQHEREERKVPLKVEERLCPDGIEMRGQRRRELLEQRLECPTCRMRLPEPLA